MGTEDREPVEPAEPSSSTTVIDQTRPLSRSELKTGRFREIQLEVVGGPMDGEKRRVEAASFTIGRGETNDLTLRQDATISGRHARIVREGQHYWLEDLDSSNGTFIGDQRIQERVLIGAGTVFVVGRTSLEFLPS